MTTKMYLSDMPGWRLVNTSTGQKVLADIHLFLLDMQIRDKISMKPPPDNAVMDAISCQLIRHTSH